LLWALFIVLCIFLRELCAKCFNLLFNNRNNHDKDDKQSTSTCKVSDSTVKEHDENGQLKREVVCKNIEPVKDKVNFKSVVREENDIKVKEDDRCSKCHKKMTRFMEVHPNRGNMRYRCEECDKKRAWYGGGFIGESEEIENEDPTPEGLGADESYWGEDPTPEENEYE
jgi:hypothetical protein